ncbi:hypothetical protein HMPREF1548_01769 [Clostridium sp. KLE 1755]|nr:hypothetical protein HMPREF1548_01769 [Clostridium sp. KLE 1755]
MPDYRIRHFKKYIKLRNLSRRLRSFIFFCSFIFFTVINFFATYSFPGAACVSSHCRMKMVCYNQYMAEGSKRAESYLKERS